MDRTVVALVLLLCVAGAALASPITRQDLGDEMTESTPAQPNLLIVAREEKEEEALVPSQSSGLTPAQPNFLIVTRGEEEEALVPSQISGLTPAQPNLLIVTRGEEEEALVPSQSSGLTPAQPNLLIVAREEEEEEALVPSQSSGVFYRGEEELISSPALVAPRLLVEDDVDVLGGELMETANSGLVFRPQFRYRKQSRRRYNRNTRRRYGAPLFFGY